MIDNPILNGPYDEPSRHFAFDPAVLAEGRERWRRKQVGALVRDAPDEAVRVLSELGYEVSPPASGEHKPNSVALQHW